MSLRSYGLPTIQTEMLFDLQRNLDRMSLCSWRTMRDGSNGYGNLSRFGLGFENDPGGSPLFALLMPGLMFTAPEKFVAKNQAGLGNWQRHSG